MTQAVFMNTNHIFMRNNSFFVITYKISVKIHVENISYLKECFYQKKYILSVYLAEHCGRPRLQRPQDQLLHVQANGTQGGVEVANVESSEVMMTKLFFCPLQFDF